jgi:hypothetical protein
VELVGIAIPKRYHQPSPYLRIRKELQEDRNEKNSCSNGVIYVSGFLRVYRSVL